MLPLPRRPLPRGPLSVGVASRPPGCCPRGVVAPGRLPGAPPRAASEPRGCRGGAEAQKRFGGPVRTEPAVLACVRPGAPPAFSMRGQLSCCHAPPSPPQLPSCSSLVRLPGGRGDGVLAAAAGRASEASGQRGRRPGLPQDEPGGPHTLPAAAVAWSTRPGLWRERDPQLSPSAPSPETGGP